MQVLNEAAVLLPAFLLVFTVRGFFKALMAKRMGDSTAYDEGFLSLNPLAHMDLTGLLVVLFGLVLIGSFASGFISRAVLFSFLIIAGVRWTYEVPYNVSNFKSLKKGMIFTTLAGPLGNFLLALFFYYLLAYVPFTSLPLYVYKPLVEICQVTIDLSIWFGILDLIPLPPFDGGRLLPFILPASSYDAIRWLEEYALFILLFLFLVPGVSDIFFMVLNYMVLLVKTLLTCLVF